MDSVIKEMASVSQEMNIDDGEMNRGGQEMNIDTAAMTRELTEMNPVIKEISFYCKEMTKGC